MRLATRTLRREDARLLTGRGHYVADFHVDGELHACFLRSDRAHARIASIDTVSAREQSGVVAVFTGADIIADAAIRDAVRTSFATEPWRRPEWTGSGV